MTTGRLITLEGGEGAGKSTVLDAIRERLALYQEQTAPLIEWFEARGKLVTVDGDAPTDTVTKSLVAAIDERLA